MTEPESLWNQLVFPENLSLAYRRARKGKTRRPDIAQFSLNVERELIDLCAELQSGVYRPQGYRQFFVHDRKPRLISAAPFRDRVVHHALMQVTEPLFESCFSENSWACRRGKGTHGAVKQYQRWSKRHAYVLKMDIQSYFHRIDRSRLLAKIENLIGEEKIIRLFQWIIDSQFSPIGRGLPIGNLTSQILSNLYLNDFDHFVTDRLGYSCYLRYVDDMAILSDDKPALWRSLCDVEDYLAEEGLNLHPQKVLLTPTRCGLDFLGYRVYPRMLRLRSGNGHRFRRSLKRKAKAYQRGDLDWNRLNAGVRAWIGHAAHGATRGLRKALFSEILIRAGMPEQAVDSGRFVEQQTDQPPFRQPEQESGG